VARELGHPHYAALGLSRKFWYDEDLSEPMSSSTSPDQKKSIYLDPALLPRLKGQRVLLVDDVINTGMSASAAIRLLQRAGAEVVGLLVVLTEGHAWEAELRSLGAEWPDRVHALGHIPLFSPAPDGRWQPDPRTL
jgi:adenine/guanine phosphoribosyltransferase-like PRPP-binding protein